MRGVPPAADPRVVPDRASARGGTRSGPLREPPNHRLSTPLSHPERIPAPRAVAPVAARGPGRLAAGWAVATVALPELAVAALRRELAVEPRALASRTNRWAAAATWLESAWRTTRTHRAPPGRSVPMAWRPVRAAEVSRRQARAPAWPLGGLVVRARGARRWAVSPVPESVGPESVGPLAKGPEFVGVGSHFRSALLWAALAWRTAQNHRPRQIRPSLRFRHHHQRPETSSW